MRAEDSPSVLDRRNFLSYVFFHFPWSVILQKGPISLSSLGHPGSHPRTSLRFRLQPIHSAADRKTVLPGLWRRAGMATCPLSTCLYLSSGLLSTYVKIGVFSQPFFIQRSEPRLSPQPCDFSSAFLLGCSPEYGPHPSWLS